MLRKPCSEPLLIWRTDFVGNQSLRASFPWGFPQPCQVISLPGLLQPLQGRHAGIQCRWPTADCSPQYASSARRSIYFPVAPDRPARHSIAIAATAKAPSASMLTHLGVLLTTSSSFTVQPAKRSLPKTFTHSIPLRWRHRPLCMGVLKRSGRFGIHGSISYKCFWTLCMIGRGRSH